MLDVAHYRVSVPTSWQPERAFAFMADLRNFAVWDPGVRGVRMVAGDVPGPGAAFDVDVRVPFGAMTLRYEVVAWEPPGRVVVRAQRSTLVSLDEITIDAARDGSTVTYDADLSLMGALRLANPLLGIAFGRIGDRAAEGLREALAGEPPAAQ
jgi:hypothetical protein